MKITKNRLKEIIKEELRKDLLQESEGWFNWKEVDSLLAERDENGEVTRDLIEVLQEMGHVIATDYSSSMNNYDMESMDFIHDVLGNYEDELEPYRGEYPNVDMDEMAEILGEALQDALEKEDEFYRTNLEYDDGR